MIAWGEDEPEAEAVRAAARKKLGDVFPKLDGVPAALAKVLGSSMPPT